ncbi:rho GTPase-activating protein 19-like isoform X2 [Dendronephthya gigantea]|uniref:rho GTPase-activating protein 19-like isoform X2 n=1 Tax=Dendronephthya gigantea TaxID=151771 RepID=UPI001069EF57|nr:rho GTPase-activating protein 19-like isoform X2 [Dendronephthya gigantea]
MSKREAKDPNAVVLIRRLLQIIDLGMIEDLQSAEQTMNVSRNLEIAGDLGVKKGKNFFSKSSEKINKILHKSGPSPIFNQPLSEANVHRVSVLIDYLKKHVNAEGIFRISGSKKRQDELKHLLDKDMQINFEKDTFTEHDVASILKYFLAELPEPIITSAHVRVHMQVADLGDEEKQIKALQLLFLLIPPANRHLLQQLLELLHEIANIKENKMSACSLALVFAPSVIQYKHKSSSCLSVVPEDITTFTGALAFMIEHVKHLFLIPDDLLQEIELQKSKNLAQDVDTAVVRKPFCAQIDARLYSTAGSKNTADALVDLYTQMAAMEDTPMKRQFLQKFAQVYPGTPPFKPKTKKSTDEERKTTFTAPKRLSPRLRNPLQSVNRTETESLCDSPTGNFRPFITPGKESCFQRKTGDLSRRDLAQTPSTPSGNFHRRSPSTGSFRNPFKRKRRTKTIGSSSESSCDDLSKQFTPKPRRTSSSSELEKPVSVPIRAATAKKAKKNAPTVMPVIKKSLTAGDNIRKLYSTPMNSKRIKPFPASAAK